MTTRTASASRKFHKLGKILMERERTKKTEKRVETKMIQYLVYKIPFISI